MIIEGRHSELGRGVFISDIQVGSPAEQSGLAVGDMILCVNQTDLIGADYDTVRLLLKNCSSFVTRFIIHYFSSLFRIGSFIIEECGRPAIHYSRETK